jgi:hypothetical protein
VRSHGNPLEEEVAGGRARDIDHSNAEVRVPEIRGTPRTAPCIGRAAKRERRQAGSQSARCFRSRPGRAAIPGQLHAHSRRAGRAVGSRIEPHFNPRNRGAGRNGDAEVVEAMPVLPGVGTRGARTCPAVGVAGDCRVVGIRVRSARLETVAVAATVGRVPYWTEEARHRTATASRRCNRETRRAGGTPERGRDRCRLIARYRGCRHGERRRGRASRYRYAGRRHRR